MQAPSSVSFFKCLKGVQCTIKNGVFQQKSTWIPNWSCQSFPPKKANGIAKCIPVQFFSSTQTKCSGFSRAWLQVNTKRHARQTLSHWPLYDGAHDEWRNIVRCKISVVPRRSSSQMPKGPLENVFECWLHCWQQSRCQQFLLLSPFQLLLQVRLCSAVLITWLQSLNRD